MGWATCKFPTQDHSSRTRLARVSKKGIESTNSDDPCSFDRFGKSETQFRSSGLVNLIHRPKTCHFLIQSFHMPYRCQRVRFKQGPLRTAHIRGQVWQWVSVWALYSILSSDPSWIWFGFTFGGPSFSWFNSHLGEVHGTKFPYICKQGLETRTWGNSVPL